MINLDAMELDTDIKVDSPDLLLKAETAATLPPEGWYTFALLDWELPTNDDGEVVTNRVVINSVEILEGPPEATNFVNRRVYRFNPIWTKPYKNRAGLMTSGIAQFCMGIDDTVQITTLRDAATLLEKAKDQHLPIRAQLIWEGFDRTYYNEQNGRDLEKGSKELAELRNACSVKYMRNYPTLPDGTPVPEATGPTGNTIEARLTIDRVVPSSKRR